MVSFGQIEGEGVRGGSRPLRNYGVHFVQRSFPAYFTPHYNVRPLISSEYLEEASKGLSAAADQG